MAKKPTESPFQALEEEAYHAYREWPLWLVLRERDLITHLTQNQTTSAPAVAEIPQTSGSKGAES